MIEGSISQSMLTNLDPLGAIFDLGSEKALLAVSECPRVREAVIHVPSKISKLWGIFIFENVKKL